MAQRLRHFDEPLFSPFVQFANIVERIAVAADHDARVRQECELRAGCSEHVVLGVVGIAQQAAQLGSALGPESQTSVSGGRSPRRSVSSAEAYTPAASYSDSHAGGVALSERSRGYSTVTPSLRSSSFASCEKPRQDRTQQRIAAACSTAEIDRKVMTVPWSDKGRCHRNDARHRNRSHHARFRFAAVHADPHADVPLRPVELIPGRPAMHMLGLHEWKHVRVFADTSRACRRGGRPALRTGRPG